MAGIKELFTLLQKIKDNPVIYIDKPSITCLDSFLTGYIDGLITLGFTDIKSCGMEGFQEWIQERAKTNLTLSWAGIILFRSGSERAAFNSFFELFEQFLKQKNASKIQENEDILRLRQDLMFPRFDIYKEILGAIKKRPGMYLGASPITELDMLLRGYIGIIFDF
ncbi:hypothetical protein IQ277_24090 [Nostocales cyanobacterium LEGE 12452]|nr:hypothetical protein [Nostocales cyanobacterium LEGE 12452]